MAFMRTLARNLSNIHTRTVSNCRVSSPFSFKSVASQNSDVFMAIGESDRGSAPARSTVQRRSIFRPANAGSVWFGDQLVEKLKAMDIMQNRLRLDGLVQPSPKPSGPTMEDATRKLLVLSKQETIKSKLRGIDMDSISRKEFVQICMDSCSSRDEGIESAKMLDESGTVIALGDLVVLRPEQVLKAIETMISDPTTAPDRLVVAKRELEEMGKRKTSIDNTAEKLVRRELLLGLGFFVIQTLGFMRMTFWDLSWDVMEPVCFYVTSGYCIAGYAFFLRTSKEPSFGGFLQSRLSSKKKTLMELQRFDIRRYNELLREVSAGASPSIAFPAGTDHPTLRTLPSTAL